MADRYDGEASGPIPSPRALFEAFAGNGGARPRFHRGFRLVAAPGQALRAPLRPGDVLIRRIPGDGYVHVAFVAADDVLPLGRALERGWRVESTRPGGYVVVVEAGARPHRRADAFARRVLDPSGRVPAGQVVVRLAGAGRADEAEGSGWSEESPKRLFLILSGGPGLYDKADKEHDAAWSSFVDPVLLKSVQVDARTGKKKIVKFWADDEQVAWLIYKPAYEARWTDDVAAGRSGVSAVKKAGFSSYVDLLEGRAKERGWKLLWLANAHTLWTAMMSLPRDSISRVWFYGHARNDLWLTLEHSSGGVAVKPSSRDAILAAADVGSAFAGFRNRFQAAPATFNAARAHRFVGCNTAAYAEAWAKAYGQWTEGFVGTVQFKSVHTSSDHEPSRTTGCTLKRYGPSGAEQSGEAWEPEDAFGELAESGAPAWSGGWTPPAAFGGAEAWQAEADGAGVATLQWTEAPEDDKADAKKAREKAQADAKKALEDGKKAQADAERLAKELQPLFLSLFSSRPPTGPRIPYGSKVGKAVTIVTVAPKDWQKTMQEEGERVAKLVEPMYLKFAPDLVAQKLVDYYKLNREPFPSARLKVIDENTRLTADERGVLFSMAKVMVMRVTQEEADKADGLYSRTTDRIFLKNDSVTAGSVAHEMAHAYADGAWSDLTWMMVLRRMKDVDKLNEGMTVVLADLVVAEWFRKQPSKTTIPSTGYDATYTGRAKEFIKAVGDQAAYEAYFAGEIDHDSRKPPEDSLVIGKAKKPFKWPWR
jgi:hypothetical protein